MNRSMFLHASRRQRAVLGAAIISTFALTASASSDVTASTEGLVDKSVEHILGVLGTSDICDSGCKYQQPNLVKEVHLKPHATKSSFYKWSYIDNTKDTKFFTQVTITRKDGGAHVKLRTLTEQTDAARIDELEKASQLEHAPIFDQAITDYELTPEGDKTRVKVTAVTKVSGFVAMFKGKVKAGMQASFQAYLKNFEK